MYRGSNQQNINQRPLLFIDPLDLKRPEVIRQYPTLAAYLSQRPEPFWREVAIRAENPVPKYNSPEPHQHATKTALAVRALDRGMVDLPLFDRFVFFYTYMKEASTLRRHKDGQEEISNLFPMATSSFQNLHIAQRQMRQHDRFDRFLGYVSALEEVATTAGRPDILLPGKNSIYNGRYTEFDYWVETQIKALTQAGQQVRVKDIAISVPNEFKRYTALPLLQRANRIILSMAKLRKLYHRLPQTSITMTREFRFQVIDDILASSPKKNTLPYSIGELGNKLHISHQAAQTTLHQYRKSRGIAVKVHKGHPARPDESTKELARYFWDAYDMLNKPGKRWKYGQLSYPEIAEYINEHFHPARRVTVDRLNKLANLYLSIDVSEQFEGMPKRRLYPHDTRSIRRAIRDDIAKLLKQGHSQNAEDLVKTLQLNYSNQILARRRVRELLGELREGGFRGIHDKSLTARRDTRKLRMFAEQAIQQLEKQGFSWEHEDANMRIDYAKIAALVTQMGLPTERKDITTLLNNLRKTDAPLGEKVRPLIDVLAKVDEYLAQGMTNPEEILDAIRSPQQPLTRVTEAKIRAYVLQPQVVAYVEEMQSREGRNPTPEEIRDHLGLRTTKIPLKIGRELRIF